MPAPRSLPALLAALAVLGPLASPPAFAQSAEAAAPAAAMLAPADLARRLEAKDFTLVNVHVPFAGAIAGTDAFVPFDRLDANLASLPADKDAPIVVYCLSGRMSAIAARRLVELGYTDVSDLEGGMIAWRAAGLPLLDSQG